MDAELNTFIEQLRNLLKKTFPCILINVTQEFPFRNPVYGKLNILYSNVDDHIKLKKELFNCFTYLCEEGTTTNMGYWFMIGDQYYQWAAIETGVEVTMDAENIIRISLSEEDTKNIISEIEKLEIKFDKEYIGSPYHEIDALRKLKGCIMLVQGSSGD